ncbi:MAG: Asp-tRNA(Asn)/Glu-tRNA(Gln) amidotransferase subunit GatC [Candidatus Peregrinibacteria bacterium]
MQLSHDEVRKIARLARLGLSDAEVEKFSKQLSEILSYAKLIDEVDTSGVEPIAQITGLTNVTFSDELWPYENPEELLKCSPNTIKDNMIQVKSVFE